MNAKILRLPSVKETTGLSRASIYQKMKEGSFPKPILLSTRSVGWLEAEIAAWIASRIQGTRGVQ